MKTNRSKVWQIILYIFVGLIYALSFAIIFLTDWGALNFTADIEATLFTLSNPMKGANNDVVNEALWYCLPRIFIVVAIFVTFAIFDCRRRKHLILLGRVKKFKYRINITVFIRCFVSIMCIATLILSIFHVDENFHLFEFIKTRKQVSRIYEDYYIDPAKSNIVLSNENSEKKNLIYIYLESMETTYTSKNNGGGQDTCYIPNLVNLANENISFSNTDKIGGFRNTSGASWTMAALLATSAGIPYSFPNGGNDMNKRQTFSPNLTALGDILEDYGYNQTFLCGSDAEFGGRKLFFETHGNYEILDLFAAREKGYIPQDYYEWWGFEDKYLYEIAKNELLLMAEKDEPFNLTMLSVDTHHQDGYVCDLCGNQYDNKTANVVACADKQIKDFIDWCRLQEFYDDTVIVITGDHTRMDSSLVSNVSYDKRTIYNCFINSFATLEGSKQNRISTSMDIFPTILASLGFTWDGNRLGLGTNLFSSQQTLAEELDFGYLNNELKKSSNFYMKHFY